MEGSLRGVVTGSLLVELKSMSRPRDVQDGNTRADAGLALHR